MNNSDSTVNEEIHKAAQEAAEEAAAEKAEELEQEQKIDAAVSASLVAVDQAQQNAADIDDVQAELKEHEENDEWLKTELAAMRRKMEEMELSLAAVMLSSTPNPSPQLETVEMTQETHPAETTEPEVAAETTSPETLEPSESNPPPTDTAQTEPQQRSGDENLAEIPLPEEVEKLAAKTAIRFL